MLENNEINEINENNGNNGFCSTFFKSGRIRRQYTLTNEDDFINVNNGLCPDYALCWCDEYNAKYWPNNHDFKGNIEKRLTLYSLRCIILRKLNDIRNKTLPHLYIKEVRFNIFKEIIPFDEDLPALDMQYF